jgi:PAS domain S-box-containing protein
MMDKAVILAVDDTPESLALLAGILTPAGYHVLPADSGELALAAAVANPPDMILLDVRMKGLDGLEVCRRLKAAAETKHIPIILISAFADVKEWVKGLQMGAADYISKPFQSEELLMRVKIHLALSRANVSLDKQSAALHQTNEQLQYEINKRLHIEDELRKALEMANRSRRALLSTAEDHKRAEESLRESEDKFKYVFDNSVIGKSITLPNGEITVNKAFGDMLGYSAEGLKSRKWQELSHPDDEEMTKKTLDAVISGKKDSARFEKRYFHKNGSIVWADVSTSLRRDRTGKPLYFMTAVIDITNRKLAEETIRQSEERLRAILDATPFPIAIVDVQDNKIDFWSSSALALFGHTAPTAAEWYELAYPDPDYRNEVIERWKPFLEKARPSGQAVNTGEYRITCRDGSVCICELYATFLAENLIVTFNDISERKRAEEALRLKNIVFDFSLAANSIADGKGTITEANEAFVTLWGYPAKEEVVGKPLLHFLQDEKQAVGIITALNTQGKWEGEYTAQRKDGSTFTAYGLATDLKDPSGKLIGYQSAVIDITDRKQAERKLQTLSSRNQAMLEAIPDIIMEVDTDKVYSWANHAGIDFFGADVIGREASYYFAGEQKTYLTVKPIFNGKEDVIYVESWQRRRDGEKRLLAWWCRVLKDESGNMTGALSSARDITEIQRAEEALRKSELKFRETIVNLDEGYYSVTLDGKLLEHNQAFNRILGFDIHKNLKGVQLPDFWQDPGQRQEYLKAFAATGSITNYQIDAKTRTGGKITILASAHLVKDENNRPQWIEGVFLDISERIRAELEIQRLNEELERRVLQRTAQLETANKELEAFSYSVSHDLRAPLRAIDGFARIVLEDYAKKLDDEGRRLLGVISSNTNKMGQLIDDLLAFSRLSRQQMAFAPVDLAALADDAFSELKSTEKGRRIEFKIGTHPAAFGDRSMLRHVLLNLLSNALKFTRPRAKARIEFGAQAAIGETICYVKDNGVGFNMEYAHKLFGVFQRLHGSDEFEGTGVGLAIVQRIVLRHGGRVWAESSKKGATFYFTIPNEKGRGLRG